MTLSRSQKEATYAQPGSRDLQFRGTSCSCSLGPLSNLILLFTLLPSSVVGTFTHW